jgi:uncharacterized protein YukE
MSSSSRSLIGGDIGGLAALASRLNGYPPQIDDVVHTLNHQVDGLVHDASWWGDAANAFKHRWEVDADGAEALGHVLLYVAGAVGNLAGNLRRIEDALETAISEAHAAGVLVGPDGHPPVLPQGASPAVQAAAATYTQEWQLAQDMATQARMDANQQLMDVEGLMAPQGNGTGTQLSPDQWEMDADYLRGFWAAPVVARKYLALRLPKLRAERQAAHAKFTQAVRDNGRRGLKTPDSIKADRRASVQKFQDAYAEEARLERVEKNFPIFKAMNVRVGSVVVKLAPGLASDSKLFKIFADIPVLDLAAVGVGTALQSVDDNQKGEDWSSAVPKELASNVAGLAAGIAVGALIVGGAAMLGISAPVGVAIAAIAVGGVVAVGVGLLVTNAFHEHWDEDIHKYGLVGGIAAGVVHIDQNTAKDIVNLGKNTLNTAQNVWHSIFG